MQKARALALLLVAVGFISPAHSQGMMEGTFVRGLGAGMGAGLAGSMGKGKVVRRTYESMLQAQQAMIAQTKQIEQYVAAGVQLEAKKQWTSAEQYFQEALKMIAKRDGPGSQKSAPVLAHLAKVSKNQNKLDEAIGYQKTVVAFANVAKAQNPAAAVQAQSDLSKMYIDKGDFSNAEGVLKQSADIVRHDRSVGPKAYSTTLRVYGEVLRKLNKDAEADSIDAELAAQAESNATTAKASTTAAPATPAVSTSQAVSSIPPAVPAQSTSISTSAPVSASAGAASPVPAETANATVTTAPGSTAVPEGAITSTAPVKPENAADVSSTTAIKPDASPPSASSSNSGALLPPPTADWPVLDSNGKISSQPSTAAAEAPASPPADPETPATPATPADPATPATPATSATPATPATPADPATPATPATSATPATPATPPPCEPANSGSQAPTAPATQPTSEPAITAPPEAAGSEKAESKQEQP